MPTGECSGQGNAGASREQSRTVRSPSRLPVASAMPSGRHDRAPRRPPSSTRSRGSAVWPGSHSARRPSARRPGGALSGRMRPRSPSRRGLPACGGRSRRHQWREGSTPPGDRPPPRPAANRSPTRPRPRWRRARPPVSAPGGRSRRRHRVSRRQRPRWWDRRRAPLSRPGSQASPLAPVTITSLRPPRPPANRVAPSPAPVQANTTAAPDGTARSTRSSPVSSSTTTASPAATARPDGPRPNAPRPRRQRGGWGRLPPPQPHRTVLTGRGHHLAGGAPGQIEHRGCGVEAAAMRPSIPHRTTSPPKVPARRRQVPMAPHSPRRPVGRCRRPPRGPRTATPVLRNEGGPSRQGRRSCARERHAK